MDSRKSLKLCMPKDCQQKASQSKVSRHTIPQLWYSALLEDQEILQLASRFNGFGLQRRIGAALGRAFDFLALNMSAGTFRLSLGLWRKSFTHLSGFCCG